MALSIALVPAAAFQINAMDQETLEREIEQLVETQDIQKVLEFLKKHPDKKELALLVACEQGLAETARILIENGANINTYPYIFKAAYLGIAKKSPEDVLKTIEVLLKKGVDAKMENDEISPLEFALLSNNLNVMKLLIEKGGVNMNANLSSSVPRTPLSVAVDGGIHSDIATYLIEKGADVNCKDPSDDTPLHQAFRKKLGGPSFGPFKLINDAVENERINVMKLLIEKGADLNAKNNEGRTPLEQLQKDGFNKEKMNKLIKQLSPEKKKLVEMELNKK